MFPIQSTTDGSKLYVDDVFSTYLYTGNDSTQTINNGIDLAGKGGMVWLKSRNSLAVHAIWDSSRGAGTGATNTTNKVLSTNLTDPQGLGTTYNGTNFDYLSAFNSSGFTVTAASVGQDSRVTNYSSNNYTSWTFRKAPKFFDVVTYTGNGVAGRQIPHSLGIAPGMVIVKRTDSAGNWAVYHRAVGATKYLLLQTNDASLTLNTIWNDTEPTSTTFTVGVNGNTNGNTFTYVAYLFAHDPSADGIIQCGSFLSGSGTATVTLGWEPQLIMYKPTTTTGDWRILDTMRGLTANNSSASTVSLAANAAFAESSVFSIQPTATGIQFNDNISNVNDTYIYLAIRRPNKPPTSGTEVFAPVAVTNSTGTTNTTSFPVDLQFSRVRNDIHQTFAVDRLRGVITTPTDTTSPSLQTQATNAESNGFNGITRYWNNAGFQTGSWYNSVSAIYWNFRRAPGFFDEVCYTGTGVTRTVNHNLGVPFELGLFKKRAIGVADWRVYVAPDKNLLLNTTDLLQTDAVMWNNTSPTASVFSLGNRADVNEAGGTYVAYLFATLPGISKVGSYTGNGSSQTINCGFSTGARFILIKRTDSTGDWYVWDSARGIVSANDPHLSLNTTAAEVTTDDSVDPDNSGFIVNQNTATNINVSSATYIYLAIA